MTTSSSEVVRGGRCTRISPSAILDDRLTGRDLDWARDHLRRCDTCRDRIEDFQEMRLRLERLPQAPVGSAAIEDAFVVVVPDAPRPVPSQTRLVGAPTPTTGAGITAPPAHPELPTPSTPDVASVPDLLSELEQEIFRDRGWGEELAGLPEAFRVPDADPEPERSASLPLGAEPEAPPVPPEPALPAPPEPPWLLREVAVQSGPRSEAGEAVAAAPVASHEIEAEAVEPPAPDGVAHQAPAAPARPDTAIRLAVGLGAAACVLVAALLYESGWFPAGRPLASASPHPAVSASASHRAGATSSIRPSATPAPTPTPATVLATLGQGVSGESVFRIRPGTAVPTWTRLVFDLTGRGLPTMVIAQPDLLHLQVTFKDTTGAGVPVGGIHSRQVTGIEPAVQQGPDLVITVDLVAPVRLVDFTLPPAQGYAPRLVLDLHST